ncbi:MAG TPA: tetratricopeptide repeat protein, partial [Candidatus Cloacimonadota bacterium]|nr:tetratricopeptide repeat protein [Candidatus Cloacimonadota bacterium]
MENYENEYLQGLKYFQENDVPNAIKHWENAAKINPKSAKIFSILGNAYKILNEIDLSFDYIETAAYLEPENFSYLYNLGLVLFENKRYVDAAPILEKALFLDSKNHELLNDLGVVYFKLEDYVNAEIKIRQAIALSEDYYVAKVNLVTVLLSAKKMVEAGIILSELEKIYGIDANI